MYLVFYVQVCFVLVSSNPLYDFHCCPTTYPSYGNDQQFVVQRSNYNPYPLDPLVHQRMNLITNSQSVPHQYQYLNSNNIIPNYQLYNQNGLDIQQPVPETETEKVINNYILIPQEYFYNDVVKNEIDKKTGSRSKTNDTKNKKNKSRRRRPDMSPKIHNANEDISNPETKKTRLKGYKEETECVKSGRSKSKKKNYLLKTDVQETLPLKREKSHAELIKNTNNHLISSSGKKNVERSKPNTNKQNYEEPKTTKGSTKKKVVNDYIPEINNKSEKKDDTGFADVNVCFDINEDCADLVGRHTRNKDVNKKNKPQSLTSTPDLPNNLNNYMNSLTFNQQMNPNIFNPNVNFPFNFDYLHQMSQTSNVKPKEVNNRRRNRKKKQPSSNRQTNLNKKNKIFITAVESCDKVVELTPEIPKIETTTFTTETTLNTEKPETKNIVQEKITLEKDQAKNVVQEVLTLEKDQDSNSENPIRTYIETFEKVLSNDDITTDNNVPFENYNDVTDEYYPDFTLDNIYVSSKEDYDFGNFHDRYYYAFGDKPEHREKRRYEHPNDNKLNSHRKLNRYNQNKNFIQESSKIQEIICKTDLSKEKVTFLTPPALEFPGFKTEMINKEKYFAEEEHRSKNYDLNGVTTNKMCPSSKQAERETNQYKNNIEMVFANSKVVRYGTPEKDEVILKVLEPKENKEFKNLISNDGKTTVVIANSLGYSK